MRAVRSSAPATADTEIDDSADADAEAALDDGETPADAASRLVA